MAERDLSIGMVARVCCVSCASVNKWCKRGILKFHRLPDLPGRKHPPHKRVRPEDLLRFLEVENKWPIDQICPSFRPYVQGRLSYAHFAAGLKKKGA